MAVTIETLREFTFVSGSGNIDDKTCCVMTAAAILAGEQFGDRPSCVCPVIRKYAIRLNDRIIGSDVRKKLLLPIVKKLIGTRAALEVEIKRAFVAANDSFRIFAPLALDKIGLYDWAQTLRDLPEIVDEDTAAWAQTWVNAATYAVYAADAATHTTYAADAATHATDAVNAAVYAADAATYAAYAAVNTATHAADTAMHAADVATYAADAATYAADAAMHAADAADATYAAAYAARREVYVLGVATIKKMVSIK